jgi:hypothetical protein
VVSRTPGTSSNGGRASPTSAPHTSMPSRPGTAARPTRQERKRFRPRVLWVAALALALVAAALAPSRCPAFSRHRYAAVDRLRPGPVSSHGGAAARGLDPAPDLRRVPAAPGPARAPGAACRRRHL